MPEGLALVDTDVASALYRERYFDRRVPATLADALANRRLAISLVTLGEAHYGARKRKWGPERDRSERGSQRASARHPEPAAFRTAHDLRRDAAVAA